MSSQPVDQPQQQQPPVVVNQQAYSPHPGGGSVGPVIAVLAVIIILGVIAGLIGRLCAGGRIFGLGQYDFEGWIERKCGSCIDGRVELPPAPQPHQSAATNGAPSVSVPITIPMEPPPQGPKQQQQHAAEPSARRAA